MQLLNKKIVLANPGDILIREEQIDFKLNDDEVLIEIDRITLCGSDFKLFNGQYNAPSLYPIIIGHEWAGKILFVGKKVTNFEIGDKVTGDCSVYCDHCDNCKKDKNLCSNITKYGITRDGYGQKYKVAPEKYLYKIPKNMPLKHAALTECFAVAKHAIDKAFSEESTTKPLNILIVGSGPIGMAIHSILFYKYGHKNIWMNEKSDKQKDLVQNKFAQIKFIGNNRENDAVRNGFNIIFEASGSNRAFDSALEMIALGGTLVCLGFIPKGEIQNLSKIVTSGARIIGSIGGTHQFEEIINFLNDYPAIPEKFIQFEYTCSNTEKIFLNNNIQEGNLKTQIIFN